MRGPRRRPSWSDVGGQNGLERQRRAPLLVGGPPYPDESFHGYIVRLTERNGYLHPNWILSLAGLPVLPPGKAAIVFSIPQENLAALSDMTGASMSELSSILCPLSHRSSFFGDVHFFGQPVSQYLLRHRSRKICPACLRDSGYHRRLWDLVLFTVCPVHRNLLVDHCWCGLRLGWNIRRVVFCQKGHDLRNLPLSPNLESHEVYLARQIHWLCGLSFGGPPISEEPLRNLSLKGLLSAVCFAIGQLSGVVDVSGKRAASIGTCRDVHDQTIQALELFRDWPGTFYRHLESRSQEARGRGLSGVSHEFLQLKGVLYGKGAQLEFGFFRSAFEGYLQGVWEGGRLGARLNYGKRGAKFVSQRTAATMLSMTKASVDANIVNGRLKAHVRSLGHTRLILIEARSVRAFKRTLERCLYRTEVEAILAVSASTVMQLVEKGVLVAVRGPTVDGCSDWRIESYGPRALLRRFTSAARVSARDEIRFLHAARIARRFDRTAGDIISAVWTSRLSPTSRISDVSGIPGFNFSREDIVRWSLSPPD